MFPGFRREGRACQRGSHCQDRVRAALPKGGTACVLLWGFSRPPGRAPAPRASLLGPRSEAFVLCPALTSDKPTQGPV